MIRTCTRPLAAAAALIGLWSAQSSAQTGVQVNVDANGHNILNDAANEPTLAISPVDPQVMVIGWRQFNSVSSDKRFAGYAHTSDGGQTWTNGGVLASPPNRPLQSGQSDPLLAVDSTGVFYYWSEVFEPQPPTTHYVYRSLDGGATWTTPAQVQDPPIAGDKDWMIIDRTGGIGDGLIYGGWTSFAGNNYTVFTRSTDGGLTFSPPVRIADRTGSQYMLNFAIGPDGELYAAWRNYDANAIYVTKSVNAQNPAATPTFDALGAGGSNGLDIRIDAGNDPGFPTLNPVGFHQIWIGVDGSDGPRRGWVYCVWADRRYDVCDILFARSTDGGRTWQSGTRINDDLLGDGTYQWMVAMSVAPNGRIDVVWYDTRDDVENRWSSLYYSHSQDGGTTWTRNRRLTAAFDTTVGFPVQQKIGDYTQIVSQDDTVNIAYAATFNGEQDIWFLRISPFPHGDLNCDGAINNLDINHFIEALFAPDDYLADHDGDPYPTCDILNGDFTHDGAVDNQDIDGFVFCLFNPTCP